MSANPFDRNKTKEARLGQLITEPGEQNQRDAVHFAVVPIIASGPLKPGQRIGVNKAGTHTDEHAETVGIVDPFYSMLINKGETFWLVLYQGQVTTLRHEWTHPAFPSVRQPERQESGADKRMMAFATECHYDTLTEFLAEVRKAVQSGDSVYVGDNEGASCYDGFWNDYNELTGMSVPDDQTIWFSCGC